MKGKKSTIWFEVTCDIHGTKEAKDTTGTKRLKVATPKNKREKMRGCPICRSEQE